MITPYKNSSVQSRIVVFRGAWLLPSPQIGDVRDKPAAQQQWLVAALAQQQWLVAGCIGAGRAAGLCTTLMPSLHPSLHLERM